MLTMMKSPFPLVPPTRRKGVMIVMKLAAPDLTRLVREDMTAVTMTAVESAAEPAAAPAEEAREGRETDRLSETG